ncbi:uncharacterized protein LOC123037356 [Drosophila rhopaloa]|uniref:Reverse transcriptase domain-containing protein n=1 Tax=Drosophila rhopaloa TaxID=1041015 RepID=A0ABM5J1P0_DRORH|nr:uncharacterized protein LOC123037171 [Drosophila rhopaloa]XP_044312739.1 uncharacterized protein LOC123037182 [Drosophila rhopaloa]XP_044313431.1 uncharacterized protein LOC123037356 [Drosophila rhopaloa]
MARSTELQGALERFWLIEEFDSHDQGFTAEEQECERHFVANTRFLTSGRVQVCLPFKENPHMLGKSFEIAKSRFLQNERRLSRNPLLKEMYVQFMREYLDLNHMQLASDFDSQKTHYVIPHHGVLRSESTTTKLRVVFDASCKTTSNLSLNELLMIGPSIQQNLILTLLAFRLHRHALVADICKMYRQFEVSPDDRMYQLVLWRESSAAPLELFQLNTVTYGMSCAPFLAIRSLKYIADKFSNQFPIGAAVLKEDMYVDDLLTGADSVEELHLKATEVTSILSKAGLELAKWNTSKIEGNGAEFQFKVDTKDVTKTLGMSWQPKLDVFCFSSPVRFARARITSRYSMQNIGPRVVDASSKLGRSTSP